MSLSLDINTSEVPNLPEDDQILQITLACGDHRGDLPLLQQMQCQQRSRNDRIKICGDTTFSQQTDNSSMPKPRKYYCFDSAPQTSGKVAESGVLSRQEMLSRKSDLSRRVRTAEKALKTMLPPSTEGDSKSLVDGIIGYIKFLQLQVKELSQSRLGSESISNPLVYVEGYGHYFLHELWASKSLEEKMGELLELDPSAATQLLESKGLSVMPMALASLAMGPQ